MKRSVLALLAGTTLVLAGAAGGCGTPPAGSSAPVPAGPNQAAADKQAGLDEAVRQSEQDYRDAVQNFEDVVLTVPGDGQYVIVETAMQGEMWPGLWRTEGMNQAGDPCVWSLHGPGGRLIDNGSVSTVAASTNTYMVSITEVGSTFTTLGCADWDRA